MKFRSGFVSNSSSSSYVVVGYKMSDHPELGTKSEIMEAIVKYVAERDEWEDWDSDTCKAQWESGEYSLCDDFFEANGVEEQDCIGLQIAFADDGGPVVFDMKEVVKTQKELASILGTDIEPSLFLIANQGG